MSWINTKTNLLLNRTNRRLSKLAILVYLLSYHCVTYAWQECIDLGLPAEECEALFQLSAEYTPYTNGGTVGAWDMNIPYGICDAWAGVTCNDAVVANENRHIIGLRLTGELKAIPESIGNFSQLTFITLMGDKINGEIPESFGKLSNLERIRFMMTNLSGSIPESLGNLIKLRDIDIEDDTLTGPLPKSFGNLKSLETILIYYNLSGPIPESLGNLSNLRQLTLVGGDLGGSIPESLGNLSNLESLSLSGNQLSGTIPESLGNLNNLRQLSLGGGNLSGPIPESLGNLSNLESLALGNSKISGPIPESLGNLRNLGQLSLSNNQLSGPIPESLGNLSNLRTLDIINNQLCGEIPVSLMMLKNITPLYSLYLENNQLTASDPDLINWLNEMNPKWNVQNPSACAGQNQAPIANFTIPSEVQGSQTITLDASTSSDPDGFITKYDWVVNGLPGTGKIVSVTLGPVGSVEVQTITLTVTDDKGETASISKTLKVLPENKPPVADFTVSPNQGETPLIITLDASQSNDSDGFIKSYEWSVNGQSLNGKITNLKLTAPGDYTITLKVTDDKGGTDTSSDVVKVLPATPKPTKEELKVEKSGEGRVVSSPAGIDCGTDCTEAYAQGAKVTLTAKPDTGFEFTSWGGDCSGTGACVVDMSQSRSVTAVFSVAKTEEPPVQCEAAELSSDLMLHLPVVQIAGGLVLQVDMRFAPVDGQLRFNVEQYGTLEPPPPSCVSDATLAMTDQLQLQLLIPEIHWNGLTLWAKMSFDPMPNYPLMFKIIDYGVMQ